MANHFQMEAQHADLLALRHPESTPVPFLSSPAFAEWTKPNGDVWLLWADGAPGTDKSVLAASVVEELRRLHADDPTIGIAYVYCSHRSADGAHTVSTANDVFACLGLQMLRQAESLLPPSRRDWCHHAAMSLSVEHHMYENTGWVCMKLDEFCTTFERAYLVVDGLDCLSAEQAASVVALLEGRNINLDFDSMKKGVYFDGERMKAFVTSTPECYTEHKMPQRSVRQAYRELDNEVDAGIADARSGESEDATNHTQEEA